MKSLKVLFLLTLCLALLLLVAQNTAPIQARFLWFAAEVPAILLLFLTAAGGFAAGLLVALLIRSGAKSRRSGPKGAV
ncbi:LapA family protein [Trichloromonas sp.]|uniref:LapA family protein n=1 Tax=Trichloromonas sp. TaxID=3069249 RepID=UPI003D81BB9F